MERNLEKIIDQIDDQINETEYEVDANINVVNEFENRIFLFNIAIEELTQLLEGAENPNIIHPQLSDLNQRLAEFNDTLLSAEKNINDARQRIRDLKETKAFVKLTTKDSFHSRNIDSADKILRNPDVVKNIIEYAVKYGGSKKGKMRKNKTMKKKRSIKRRLSF